eukprot:scaffold11786_cov119-Isochrysis_galbana.AAC.3
MGRKDVNALARIYARACIFVAGVADTNLGKTACSAQLKRGICLPVVRVCLLSFRSSPPRAPRPSPRPRVQRQRACRRGAPLFGR